jgi:alpha-L-fucosidase
MAVNSSSIYGTTASPFVRLEWGRATKKEYSNATDLFLHVFEWPEDGQLRVEGLRNEVSGAYFLADYQLPIEVRKSATGIVLHLPNQALDPISTVIALKVKGELDVERILPTQTAEGAITLTVNDANIHNPGYGGRLKIRQDSNSASHLEGWTDFRSHVDWVIEIDRPGKFAIYADVAAGERSGFSLRANTANEKPFTVNSTGDSERYQRQLIGTMDLPEGESKIVMRPQEPSWRPITLRSLTLRLLTDSEK